MTVKKSQVGDKFLADVFAHADPDMAHFMARHNALLERVTVLERVIEEALPLIAKERLGAAQMLLEAALDA